MKTEPPPRHHGDARPTESLIHPDRTILEEWFRQAIAKGPAFWGTASLIIVVAVVAAVVALRWTSPSAADREAWASLMASTTEPERSLFPDQAPPIDPEALEAIYDVPKYEKTNAARWARLESATALLSQGSAELASVQPEVRAEAVSKILRAEELLEAVRDAAPVKALQRLAEFSLARAAEARLGLPGDNPNRARLDEVLEAYRQVANAYPNTPEGQAAEQLAARLDREESRQFYQSLASDEPNPAAIPTQTGADPGEMFLNPGQRQSLDGLFGEPGAPSGAPAGNIGDPALPPTFPEDLPSPGDSPSAPPDTMPEPVRIPEGDDERTKAPTLPAQPIEIEPPTEPDPQTEPEPVPEPGPQPEPSGEPEAPEPAGGPVPEPEVPGDADEPTGELPDDPFARPSDTPAGELPDDPFARPRTGGSQGDAA